VEEFWVCRHCRSLNRASAAKCYSCKQKYGSTPKQAPTLTPVAAPPPPPAPTALPPIADFGGAARQQSYLSRPVAPVSAYAAAAALKARPRTRALRLPNPVSAIKNRVTLFFARRKFVTVDWLGYLTAALLALLIADGAVLVLTLLPAAGDLLQHSNVGAAWSSLGSHQQSMAKTLALGFGSLGVVSLVCFSVFLAVTTHNATGLGADVPLMTPYRAGLAVPVAVWSQARIAVGLVVPAALIWRGYPIPGLIAWIVAVEIAQRHLDDPDGWVTRPNRHLPDLYAKLGTEGSVDSLMASLWSICFRSANLLAVATYIVPVLAVCALAASTALGRDGIPGWQSSGLGPAQLAVALLVGSLLAWTAAAAVLLVPITVGLVNRQRTRRTLVRVGRSRSWIARPGQGGYAPGPLPAPPDPFDDPLDRVIEHFPTPVPVEDPGFGAGGSGFGPGGSGFGPSDPGFGQAGSPGFGPSDPGFGQAGSPGFGQGGPGFGQGGPGFGAGGRSFAPDESGSPGFGQGGPGFGAPGPAGAPGPLRPDQASLYSPSTTSSFPWSDDSSEPPA
jgi:hypothetical protein